MATTDIFSESFETIRRYPATLVPYLLLEFLVTGLIALLVYSVAPGLAAQEMQSTGFIATLLAIIVISIIVGILLTPLFYGMYTSLQVQKIGKKRLSLENAYAAAKERYASLLGAGLINLAVNITLIALFMAIPIYLLVSNSAELHTLTGSASTGDKIGLILGIIGIAGIFAVFLIICLAVVVIYFFQYVPVLMIEKRGAWDSIKRSISIGKANFWSILGTLILFFVIAGAGYFVIGIVSTPFQLAGREAAVLVQLFLSAIFGSIIYPWYIMLMTSFYNSYVKKVK